MSNEGTIEKIIDLKHIIEYTFFKEFIVEYGRGQALNHSHIISMVVLSFCGPSPMSRISDKINLEKGSFTPICNRLIELGYVTKLRNEMDKRVYHIQLTKPGEAYADDFKKAHRKYIQDILEVFNEDEKTLYFNAIETVMTMSKTIMDSKAR